jgi:hypothetical protein
LLLDDSATLPLNISLAYRLYSPASEEDLICKVFKDRKYRLVSENGDKVKDAVENVKKRYAREGD